MKPEPPIMSNHLIIGITGSNSLKSGSIFSRLKNLGNHRTSIVQSAVYKGISPHIGEYIIIKKNKFREEYNKKVIFIG